MKAVIRIRQDRKRLLLKQSLCFALVFCFGSQSALAGGHKYIKDMADICTTMFYKGLNDDSIFLNTTFKVSRDSPGALARLKQSVNNSVNICSVKIDDNSDVYSSFDNPITAPQNVPQQDKACDDNVRKFCADSTNKSTPVCMSDGDLNLYYDGRDANRQEGAKDDYCGVLQYNDIHAYCVFEVTRRMMDFRQRKSAQAALKIQSDKNNQDTAQNSAACMHQTTSAGTTAAAQQASMEIKSLQAILDQSKSIIQQTPSEAQSAGGISVSQGNYQQAVAGASQIQNSLQARIALLQTYTQNLTDVGKVTSDLAASSNKIKSGGGLSSLMGPLVVGSAVGVPLLLNSDSGSDPSYAAATTSSSVASSDSANGPPSFSNSSGSSRAIDPSKSGASSVNPGALATAATANKLAGSGSSASNSASEDASPTSQNNAPFVAAKTPGVGSSSSGEIGGSGSSNSGIVGAEKMKKNTSTPSAMSLYEGGGGGGHSNSMNVAAADSPDSIDSLLKSLLGTGTKPDATAATGGVTTSARSLASAEGEPLVETGDVDVSLWERIQTRISTQSDRGNIAGPRKNL